MNVRLTIRRRGAQPASGTYDWRDAVARLDFAARLPDFLDFTLEDAQ